MNKYVLGLILVGVVTLGCGSSHDTQKPPLSQAPAPAPAPAPLEPIVSQANGRWSASKVGSTQGSLINLFYSERKFFGVGEDMIAVSENAQSWTTKAAIARSFLYETAYGKGRLVAVGTISSTDQTGPVRPLFLSSTDGSAWKTTKGSDDQWLTGVAFGNGRFVTVGFSGGGRGIAYVSEDGINWTETKSTDAVPHLAGVTFANQQFVAIGSGKTGAFLLTSQDGSQWTQLTPPVKTYMKKSAYGNGKTVTTGPCGVFVWNGTAWQSHHGGEGCELVGSEDMESLGATNGIVFADNQFVAVGNWAGKGLVMTSTDAVTWTRSTVENGLRMVTYGNAQWIASSGKTVYELKRSTP